MSKSKVYTVKYRRKREGKTNYKKRLNTLISHKPRLIVRKSICRIIAQIVEYHDDGDKIMVAVDSKSLEKFGWNSNQGNVPSAYLVGLLIGKLAKKKDIKEAVLDIGLGKPVKGSRLFAVLKGAVDSGLIVPHSKEILPNDSRVKGEHIAKYAESLKKEGSYEKVFSEYIKKGADPTQIVSYFEKTKKKIMEAN